MQNKTLIIRLIAKPLIGAGLLLALLALAPRAMISQAQATMPAGASWHGYIVIEFSPIGPFINGVTPEQKAKLHEAFLFLSRERDMWPAYILQDTRWRLDNLAVIVEARFLSMPTKAQAAQLISNRTGYTIAQINAAMNVTVFALGGTWIESLAACDTYLSAHSAEWEHTQQ